MILVMGRLAEQGDADKCMFTKGLGGPGFRWEAHDRDTWQFPEEGGDLLVERCAAALSIDHHQGH